MKRLSTKQLRIAELARRYPNSALTNLHHHIDEDLMLASMQNLNRKASPGVDGKTYEAYLEEFPLRVSGLLREFKSGRYRAPSVKRVYIAKGKGEKRPLGIPTMEDKVLQGCVKMVVEPVYEEAFYDFSYGFRKGRSQHQALDAMWKNLMRLGDCYVIDADIQNYFGSINYVELRKMLDKRIKDGVIRRQIDKWLKAGILEDKVLRYEDSGTPQGGVISPLLSNIYLHEVLDEWFEEIIKPLLKGDCFLIRWADDFIMGFKSKEDAERVMAVLPKRFAKYKLTLHPEKTKLISFCFGQKGGVFNFLGFTHYWGESRKKHKVVKRKTESKRMVRSLKEINNWLRWNRHSPLQWLLKKLNEKVRGHYAYYGITFNSKSLSTFYKRVKHLLHKWLNRRGGKSKWTWDRLRVFLEAEKPITRPRIVHTYS